MTTATVSIPAGNRYFLVVPLDGASEGSHGKDSDGVERAIGAITCGGQDIEPVCQ